MADDAVIEAAMVRSAVDAGVAPVRRLIRCAPDPMNIVSTLAEAIVMGLAPGADAVSALAERAPLSIYEAPNTTLVSARVLVTPADVNASVLAVLVWVLPPEVTTLPVDNSSADPTPVPMLLVLVHNVPTPC